MITALLLASSLWVSAHEAGAREFNSERIERRIFTTSQNADEDDSVKHPSALCDLSSIGCVPGTGLAEVPVEKIADDFGRHMAWVVAFNAGDLYATAIAIHRCDGACGEGNPLGPSSEARIAMKMATFATTGLTLWKLERDGHHVTALIVRWASVAVNSFLIVNNARHAILKR